MGQINWGRMLLCGLATGVVWILLSLMVLLFLGGNLLRAMPNFQTFPPPGWVVAACLILPFLVGIHTMWLYAAIRPRFGPGPKTAAVAGLIGWLAGILSAASWVAYGFIRPGVVLVPLMAALPALVLAVAVGARFYRESGAVR